MKKCSRCQEIKEEINFYKNKARKDGLNNYCKECMKNVNKDCYSNNLEKYRDIHKKWRDKNKEYLKTYRKNLKSIRGIEINEYKNLYHMELKIQALFFYSNGNMSCEMCGEDDIDVLDIHHINGNGNSHRKKEKVNILSEWCIRNNFPDGFKVLCRNCNWRENLKTDRYKKIERDEE